MNVPRRGNFPIYPYVPHQHREGDMRQVRITNHPLPHYIALYKTRKEALSHAEVLNNSLRCDQGPVLLEHSNDFDPEVGALSRYWPVRTFPRCSAHVLSSSGRVSNWALPWERLRRRKLADEASSARDAKSSSFAEMRDPIFRLE